MEYLVENLADVTLIDEDTKSILTDDANITDKACDATHSSCLESLHTLSLYDELSAAVEE